MTVSARHPGVVRVGGRLMVVDPFADRGELTEAQLQVKRLRMRLTMLFGGFLVFVAIILGGLLGAIADGLIARGRGQSFSLSLPGSDPNWVPGLDVAGAVLGVILAVFLLVARGERRRRIGSIYGGHQPSRWIDPLNDHLIGLDDDVAWTELWTLSRMYSAAERAQRELVQMGATQQEVGTESAQRVADAQFIANDTRAALEKTAQQMGVTVPTGPLPDAQAILANGVKQRGRNGRRNSAAGL